MDPKLLDAATTNTDFDKSLETALRDFQIFAGLEPTGVLNNETQSIMKLPRCGEKDKFDFESDTRKTSEPWDGGDITYRVFRYPANLLCKAVDEVMERTLAIWASVTNLNFRKTSENADINIAFDGVISSSASNVLAQASLPRVGAVYFNKSWTWTIRNPNSSVDLFPVALHEFGHALGLNHTSSNESIMNPFNSKIFNQNFTLSDGDIRAIQSLYGVKRKQMPDLCSNSTFDAIFEYPPGIIYVLKDDYYWKLYPDGLASGYPKLISHRWPGLPGNVDAATADSTGLIYFFKKNNYWCYNYYSNMYRSPYYISLDWPGIPDNIEAAMWGGRQIFYFFKGDLYWKYDASQYPQVPATYPKPVSTWGGIKGDLDDVLYVTGRRIYFFSNSSYYSYNCETNLVDYGHPYQPDYPRPTSLWWFRCGIGDTNELLTTTVNNLTSELSTSTLATSQTTVIPSDTTTLETSTNTMFVTVSNNSTTSTEGAATTTDNIARNVTTIRSTNVSDHILAEDAVDYFEGYRHYEDGDYNGSGSMEPDSWKSGASSPVLMTLVNILILFVVSKYCHLSNITA